MKKKVFSVAASCLMSMLLATWIGVAAVMCFAETFRLECALETALLVCAAGAVVFSLSMLPRRRWPVFAVEVLAVVIGAYRQLPQMKAGFERVLLQVTTQLSKDFPIAVMGSREGDARWFLLPLGLLIVWVIAWICQRKGSALPAAFVCGPVLVCCLLTVGIAPAFWLAVLTCGLTLLAVTHSVRSRDMVQGNLLAWRLLIPIMLVAALPWYLSPPEDYVRSAWSDRLLAVAEERLGIEDYSPGGKRIIPAKWNRQLKEIDLQRVGPKSKSKNEVLQYRADTYITHLRGLSLGIYENNSWSAADPYLYAEQDFIGNNQITGSGASRTLNVYTKRKEDLLYTTYFLKELPDGSTAIDDAYLENSQKLTEYAIVYGGNGRAPAAEYCDYVEQVYTQLPEALREPLQLYLMRSGLSRATPGQIANWVKNSAVYDLKTPRTPEDEDFVLYFLEESHRGYCVHFASATALLLRAQGIPARYVTGYGVDGDIGQRNTVTADQSHAWVEYFQEDIGWRVLDPTPADWQEDVGEEELPVEMPPQQPLTPENDLPEEPESSDTPEEELPEQAEQRENPSAEPETEEPAISIPLPGILELPGTAENEGAESVPAKPARKKIQIPIKMLWQFAVCIMIVAAVPAQRKIRLKLQCYRGTAGAVNRQALIRWRKLSALYHAVGTEPPADVVFVVQKARFSQHSVTQEELHLLARAEDQAIEALRQSTGLKAFWYRYIRAFY